MTLNLPTGQQQALLIDNGFEIGVALKNSLAATCAGSNGAINIWQDDEIIYCEAMRNLKSLEEKEFDSTDIDKVIEWADRWIGKIAGGSI